MLGRTAQAFPPAGLIRRHFSVPTIGARLAAIAVELSLPVTRIGAITAEPGLRIRDEAGRALAALPQAFDHFR